MKSYPKIRGYANYNVSRCVSLFLLSKEFPNVPKRKQTAGRVAMAYNVWENSHELHHYPVWNVHDV